MKLPSSPPELTTGRLTLRPPRASDADTVARLTDDPAVSNASRLIPPDRGESAASRWIGEISRSSPDEPRFTWAVTETERGIFYGMICLDFDRRNESARIDGWIGGPFRNQGIGTEACRALLRAAFGDFGIHRIEARHLMREPAAARLVEKLRLLPEGVRRQAEKWTGRFEDVAHYGLLRNDLDDRVR